MSQLQPYTSIVPRRRDVKGNPVPRRYIYAPPLINLDGEALIEAAQAGRSGGHSAADTFAWLKARNAIAARDNYRELVLDTWRRIEETNARSEKELETLRPRLEELRNQETEIASEVASLLAGMGIVSETVGPALVFGEDAPVSLEELAGEHGLPPPDQGASWAHRIGYRLAAIIGGGTIFGISLGLLTDSLQLVDLSSEWPWLLIWSALGMTVMALIGAALTPLAQEIGCELYCRSVSLPWLKRVLLIFNALFLAWIGVAAIEIESRIEQLGIFKSLAEQSSLQGIAISRADLGWVSLMLVVPALCSYVVLGLIEGERRANLARLKFLQAARRSEIRAHPNYAPASAAIERLRRLQDELDRQRSAVLEIESQIRYELSPEEKLRLEDAEMDVAGHSLAAEDLLRAGSDVSAPPGRRWSLWQRLFPRRAFAGGRS